MALTAHGTVTKLWEGAKTSPLQETVSQNGAMVLLPTIIKPKLPANLKTKLSSKSAKKSSSTKG